MPPQNLAIAALLSVLLVVLLGCAEDEDPFEP